MIKFAIRQNLKFPLQLCLWNVLRDTESTLISIYLKFDNALIYTPLMFLGEFFAGLIIYSYHKKFLTKKEEETITYQSIELIRFEKYLKPQDGTLKIFFLIFLSAFYDFVQFVLSLNNPRFLHTSSSFESRLGGFLTVVDALFYYYILKLPIFKHQLFSLIIIGICLGFVIISEFFFVEINIFLPYDYLFLLIFLTFIVQFCSAMVDSIEKYLYEYNKINQFLVLMFEGIFGFCLSFIYGLFYDPFNDISQYQKNNTTTEFTLLILGLILYLILSGGKNAFRVTTTKIYSPMTTTFLDYILNPFYMIYDFANDADFNPKGERNYAYFLLNLILAFIISFCGLVYNEFLILFCCDLEINTHDQIMKRSQTDLELGTLYNTHDDEATVV